MADSKRWANPNPWRTTDVVSAAAMFTNPPYNITVDGFAVGSIHNREFPHHCDTGEAGKKAGALTRAYSRPRQLPRAPQKGFAPRPVHGKLPCICMGKFLTLIV